MHGDGKPRLLVATSTYPRWAGDVEPAFVHELCKRLTQWFDVRVITSHSPGASAHESMDGVTVERFRYAPAGLETLVHGGGIAANLKANPWKALLLAPYLIGMVHGLWRCHRAWRPHVTHAHWFIPAGLAARAVAYAVGSAPWVVTAHGSDVHTLRGPLWRALRRWIASAAARLTAVGNPLAAQLRDECGRDVDVIPMGVDMDTVFVPAVRSQPAHTLLYVGRLVAQKRPEEAMQAFREVSDCRAGLRLEMIGDGPLRDKLGALAVSLGLADRVKFTGRLAHAELAGRYQEALATIIPSGGVDAPEGLGLVAVEALACGCPVVAAPNPALQAVLSPEAPIYVSAGASSNELGETLRDFIASHVPEDVRTAGWRSQLLAEFGWSAVAARYAAVLRATAGRA